MGCYTLTLPDLTHFLLILSPTCEYLSITKGFLFVIDAGLVERFHRQVAPAPAEFNSQSRHLSLMKTAASSSSSSPPERPPPQPDCSSSFSPAAFCSPLRNPECHSCYFPLHLLPPLCLLHQHLYYLDFYFCHFFLFLFFMLNLNLLRNKSKKHANTRKKGKYYLNWGLKNPEFRFFFAFSLPVS